MCWHWHRLGLNGLRLKAVHAHCSHGSAAAASAAAGAGGSGAEAWRRAWEGAAAGCPASFLNGTGANCGSTCTGTGAGAGCGSVLLGSGGGGGGWRRIEGGPPMI